MSSESSGPNPDPDNVGPDGSRRNVWLHVHVPKAGGSTLRQLMNRNFGKGYYNSKSLLETKQYSCTDVSEIIRCHPWVECFSDHKISLDLPFEHEHANVFAFAYVRDPVERFISRYFFHRHFEEVNCIAQRMNFREFATAELIHQDAPQQTNSQIFFLNGGRSSHDLTLINEAIATDRAFLFPIERFDESCICLERRFPDAFSDLSYVRANVSKRDSVISDSDRSLIKRYLKPDNALMEVAEQFLNRLLESTFPNDGDRESALTDFKDRCARRFHNFYPPVAPGEPVPPIGTIPAPTPPSKPMAPVEPNHDYPEETVATQPTLPTKPTLKTEK